MDGKNIWELKHYMAKGNLARQKGLLWYQL